MSDQASVRLTLEFSPSTVRRLKELEDSLGASSMTEVIEKSLKLTSYIVRNMDKYDLAWVEKE
jgi:hypothetical protein